MPTAPSRGLSAQATSPCRLFCLARPNAICSAPRSLCFLSFWFRLDEPKACHKPEKAQTETRSHKAPCGSLLSQHPGGASTRVCSNVWNLICTFAQHCFLVAVSPGGSKGPVSPLRQTHPPLTSPEQAAPAELPRATHVPSWPHLPPATGAAEAPSLARVTSHLGDWRQLSRRETNCTSCPFFSFQVKTPK